MTNSDRSIDNSNDPTLRPDFFDLIRLPIVICVDASGSMLADGGNGVPMIKMLEDMINSIIDSSELDDDEKEAVDICILKFDETVNTVVDWIPLCNFKNKISLDAYGPTSLGAALLTAVENVRKRKYLYNSCGVNTISPQIFVFTDAGDIEEVYENFQSGFNDVDHTFYTKVTVFTLPMYYNGEVVDLNGEMNAGIHKKTVKGFKDPFTFIRLKDCVNGLPASLKIITDSIHSRLCAIDHDVIQEKVKKDYDEDSKALDEDICFL